jgi:uncharacterized membrane protein YvbJ
MLPMELSTNQDYKVSQWIFENLSWIMGAVSAAIMVICKLIYKITKTYAEDSITIKNRVDNLEKNQEDIKELIKQTNALSEKLTENSVEVNSRISVLEKREVRTVGLTDKIFETLGSQSEDLAEIKGFLKNIS